VSGSPDSIGVPLRLLCFDLLPMMGQRSGMKKPLMGDFLRSNLKFPHSSEKR
jgi:hypothetical protein